MKQVFEKLASIAFMVLFIPLMPMLFIFDEPGMNDERTKEEWRLI